MIYKIQQMPNESNHKNIFFYAELRNPFIFTISYVVNFSCSRMTHVEVTIEAPYEFLHDVTYPTKQPFTSGYR